MVIFPRCPFRPTTMRIVNEFTNRPAAPFDAIGEARRQWVAHGWDGVESMSAATVVTHAHQRLLAVINQALKPFDLNFSRYEALVLLHFSSTGALPLGKMGARLVVHPTSVTNTVDRLERDGYVRRIPHADDRRTVLAEITPSGREVVLAATQTLAEIQFGLPELPDEVVEWLRRGVEVLSHTGNAAAAAADAPVIR
jgi:DNA-binding MarR family transcriptional regulator